MSAPTLGVTGNTFLVKEHVGLFRAANNYDIFDPATTQIVLTCREPKLGLITKLLRFTDFKRMTPFAIELRSSTGELVLEVTRGISLLVSTVRVTDSLGQPIGTFKQKFFSIGGAFDILDTTGQVTCSLKGKWTGWDFRFVRGDHDLARVTKKWAGLGKELLTSADNYVLEIDPSLPAAAPERLLILAAVLCIDMVLKE